MRHTLAPFLHGFLGALPHGDEVHGGGKNVALVVGNSWVWGVGHDLGFLPLYSFSDSRHPLGCSGTAIYGASGLQLGRILSPDRSAENSLQLLRLDFFYLTSSSVRNVTITEKRFQTDFRKVPI